MSLAAASPDATARAGLVFAALCALNGAFVAPVARISTAANDPLQVAVIVTLFAALAAAVVLAMRGRLLELFMGPDAIAFCALGALGTMVPTVLFFSGTARTSAIDAALCLQTEPVFSLLLSWLVLGHRLTLRRTLSAGVLLVGLALSAASGANRDIVGVCMLLATPLAWQASHLLVLRRLVTASPETLTGARYLWGGVWLGIAAIGSAALFDRAPFRVADPRAELPLLAFQGVALYFVGTMLWYQVIARLDLARATAIVVPSVPVLSTAVAYLLLGEIPTTRQLAGLAFITIGVLSFVVSPHAVEERERVPTQTAPLGADVGDEVGGDEA